MKIIEFLEKAKVVIGLIALCFIVFGIISQKYNNVSIGVAIIAVLIFGRWVSYFLFLYCAYIILDTGYGGNVAWGDVKPLLIAAVILWFIGLSGKDDENDIPVTSPQSYSGDPSGSSGKGKRGGKGRKGKKTSGGICSILSIILFIVFMNVTYGFAKSFFKTFIVEKKVVVDKG